MEKHIDVLGYLLAAVVFSVSFLGARVHASFDAVAREVREQSWRVRNALVRGEPVGPPELTDTVAVTRRTIDRVASLSRLVNYGLCAAMLVVYVSALVLLAGGTPGPPAAVLITSLVFLGAVSVVVIGELDVRKVDRDREAAVSESLAGAISDLAGALDGQRWADFGSRLAGLSDAYPGWGLLTELRAYLDLVNGDPASGLRRVRGLAAGRGPVYLSAVVGTACALAEDDSAAALRLLDGLAAGGRGARHLPSLRTALGVWWAHLDVLGLGHQPTGHSGGAGPGLGSAFAGPGRSGGRPPGSAPAQVLDLLPTQIQQTSAALGLSTAWWSSDEEHLRRLAVGTPLAFALDLVLAGDGADGGPLPRFDNALRFKDAATLETFGLIFLAKGRTREAFRMIEHSIRIMPGNYRTHWAMALVCQRFGWHTAAEASLQRMNALAPDDPLLALTSRYLSDCGSLPDPGELEQFRARGAVPRLMLALLGIDVAATPGDSVRDLFFGRLVTSALSTSRSGPAPAETLT